MGYPPPSPPGLLSEEARRRIADALTQRGVKIHCPMCGNEHFTVVEGYFTNTIQGQPSGTFVIGGPSIPTAVIICGRCGFLSQHALGALGLLSKEEAAK